MAIKNFLRESWIVSIGEIMAFFLGGALAGLLCALSLLWAGRL